MDNRVGKTYHAITCGNGAHNDKPLGTVTLVSKIGPGHFVATLDGEMIEIYSCQLQGEIDENHRS
jgi:hypothetical protein